MYYVVCCDIQMTDEALHSAARKNDTETIERLISAGSDVNILDTVSMRIHIHTVVVGSSPALAYCTIFIVLFSEVVDLYICICIRTSHCSDLCTHRLRAAAALL